MNLDQFLRSNGIEGAEFAARIGVSAASLSRIRRGDQNITREVIRRIVVETDGRVSADDLVFPVEHAVGATTAHTPASTGQAGQMSGEVA